MPSSAWAATRHCMASFTANPTFSSCLRAKATTMRGLAGSSTRNSGPRRRWTPAPRQPEVPLAFLTLPRGLEPGRGKGGKEIGSGLGGTGLKGMRPSCSGRGSQGQGSVPGSLQAPLVGGGLGARTGVCLPPAVCFFQPPHLKAPRSPSSQAQPTYLGAFSPAGSQHAPLRVPSSLIATQGPMRPPCLPIYLCP